jgi:predicted adenylyl cyclase CyaB
MKEIEILIKVLDKKSKVLKNLKKFKFLGIKKTLDVYFYDPLRGELKPNKSGALDRCFRLRQKDKKNFLVYKIDRFDNLKTWLYSDEYEVEVSDFKTTIKILKQLGFKVLVNIKNKKHTFLTNKYEIVLEDVENLGLFLEVECLAVNNKENINEVKKEIRSFIKSLDIKLGEELNVGKPELMLKLLK